MHQFVPPKVLQNFEPFTGEARQLEGLFTTDFPGSFTPVPYQLFQVFQMTVEFFPGYLFIGQILQQ